MALSVEKRTSKIVELPEHRTLGQMMLTRFLKNRMAVVGLGMLLFMISYVVIGSLLIPEKQSIYNDSSRALTISAENPLGTDSIGRDILARSIYGGQISLMIGVSAMLVSLLVGVSVGLISGYYGGFIDNILMRIAEAILSVPQILILLVLSKTLGNKVPDVVILGREFSGNIVVIIVIIGATSWMYLARIVRGNVLSLKTAEYVLAARSLGAGDLRIMLRHILPNTLAPIIVAATLGIANAVLSESYISFLGLGVQQPIPTWGNILDGSREYIDKAPWLWMVPGALILITTMGINFVGDGLRDALDPRSLK